MTLSSSQQAAIAAYTGPVTVCPPHTYSWQLGVENKAYRNNSACDRAAAKGRSTTRLVLAAHEAGHSDQEIARTLGLNISTVRQHMTKAGVR